MADVENFYVIQHVDYFNPESTFKDLILEELQYGATEAGESQGEEGSGRYEAFKKALVKALKEFELDIYASKKDGVISFKASTSQGHLKDLLNAIQRHNGLLPPDSEFKINWMNYRFEGEVALLSLENKYKIFDGPSIWRKEFSKKFAIDINATGVFTRRHSGGRKKNRNWYKDIASSISADELTNADGSGASPHKQVEFKWYLILEWGNGEDTGAEAEADVAVEGPPEKKMKIENNDDFLKNLFDDTKKDYAIVSEDGVEMKCHKSVLSARSIVFKTMIESQMREAQRDKVELNGLSGGGLKLLMRYLYGLELPGSEMTPRIALELVQNGHLHDLYELVEMILAFLLGKDEKWYQTEEEVKSLLDLFFYLFKLEGATEVKLRLHLVRILSWKVPPRRITEDDSFKVLDEDLQEQLKHELLK